LDIIWPIIGPKDYNIFFVKVIGYLLLMLAVCGA